MGIPKTASALVLIFLASSFAGCMGGPAPANQRGSDGAPVSPGMGRIEGTVVDEALRPIGRAAVVLVRQFEVGRVNTSETGKFAFEGLAAGNYALSVVASGFYEFRSNAYVQEGNLTSLSIALDAPPTAPVTHHGRVYIELAVIDLLMLHQTYALSCKPCDVYFDIDTNPTDGLFETKWEKNGAAPRVNDRALYSIMTNPRNETIANLTATGDSVWGGDLDNGDFHRFTADELDVMGSRLKVRVMGPTDGGAIVQQAIDFWVTLSYQVDLPEGFTAVPT